MVVSIAGFCAHSGGRGGITITESAGAGLGFASLQFGFRCRGLGVRV